MKKHDYLHILYAEDNEDASEMTSILLRFSEIKTTVAKTTAEAWRLAKGERFDLYLLDSDFPDGDGLELCRRLRRYASRTPIFFYSGKTNETDQKNGLAAGADEYLTKPNFDNLAEKILRSVELSQEKYYQSSENV